MSTGSIIYCLLFTLTLLLHALDPRLLSYKVHVCTGRVVYNRRLKTVLSKPCCPPPSLTKQADGFICRLVVGGCAVDGCGERSRENPDESSTHFFSCIRWRCADSTGIPSGSHGSSPVSWPLSTKPSPRRWLNAENNLTMKYRPILWTLHLSISVMSHFAVLCFFFSMRSLGVTHYRHNITPPLVVQWLIYLL